MTTPQAAAVPTVDIDAITAVVTEYYQSWFAGDGERMRACIHPSLAKRTFEQPGSDSLALHEDPTETLIQDTASGEGTEFTPTQDVTVIDVFRDMATVIASSEPFVEYLHVARFGGRWLVVNVLYTVLV